MKLTIKLELADDQLKDLTPEQVRQYLTEFLFGHGRVASREKLRVALRRSTRVVDVTYSAPKKRGDRS